MKDTNELSNTAKTFRGLSSQTLVTLLKGVADLVFFSFMSRLLGKEEFGYYAILALVLTVFRAFSEAGIGAAVIQNKDADKPYLDTAFFFSFALGVVMAVLGILFASPIAGYLGSVEVLRIPIIIVMCVLPLYGINSVLRAILIKQLRFLKFGLIQLASYTIASLVGIFMAFKGYGIFALVALTVLDVVIMNLILLVITKYRPSLKSYSWQHVKSMFSYGGWLTLENLFRNLYYQLDSLVLARLVPIATLGSFNRPRTFINSIASHVNGIFDVTLFPILSGLKDDREKIQSAFNKTVALLSVFTSLLCVGFFFNARLVVTIFFGEQWIELVPLFRILSLDFLIKANGRLCDCFFRSLALVKVNFVFRVVACVMLTGAIILGNTWGLYGIAASVVICNALLILAKVFYLSQKIHISFASIMSNMVSALRTAFLVAIPSTFYLLFFESGTLWNSIVFLACFGVLIVALLLFCPKLIGKDYYQSVYPTIQKAFNKLTKRDEA